MDARARQLLDKLLRDGDKADAGVRSRRAALTRSNLAAYRSEKSLQAKELFEVTMQAARAEGAIHLVWDNPQEGNGFIERVELVNPRALAKFLGCTPLADLLADASARFTPHVERFPVLNDVLQRWAQLRTVRKLSPDSVQEWLDAVKVIDSARDEVPADAISVPIREASYRLFKDSKRVEKLVGPADVLLCGSVEAAPRDQAEVWKEIGLFREEQPALLAGNVIVKRERVTACLDAPYGGLPTRTVLGLACVPRQVMTIENLTTFHSEARRRCAEDVLLIFTAGTPSPAWRAMYGRILQDVPEGTPILHWGDVDEGGFRIASMLARCARDSGHVLQPWKMHPEDIPVDVRCEATPYVLERIRHFASAAGWAELGEAMLEAGFTLEQEGLPYGNIDTNRS
ncbi:Wadjet anti-phage system protein JetD domain-containing protein [Ralstonia solanacearum]|uniref:Wadjet anti-phage system protein JetD domain-containing protein n=1 Tax=Ralstonia solanacearum TaxID=305 RepID=UPI0018D11BA7|nr:Wadjet anti-phage system protein JetD domain-containing protein [Ralstonia solanacearum]